MHHSFICNNERTGTTKRGHERRHYAIDIHDSAPTGNVDTTKATGNKIFLLAAYKQGAGGVGYSTQG